MFSIENNNKYIIIKIIFIIKLIIFWINNFIKNLTFLIIIVINYTLKIINLKDNTMSYDIYSNINKNEIIKIIIRGKSKFNRFIQEAILEYKLGLEYDGNVVEIKKGFIRFIINILQCIEDEICKNDNISRNSFQNVISYYFDKFVNLIINLFKKDNSTDAKFDDEAKQIRNSSFDNMAKSSNIINYLKNLILEILENVNKSGILSEDEINEFIIPYIQEINLKYYLDLSI